MPLVSLLLCCNGLQAYHIEIIIKSLYNTPVFLAGYYGDRIVVIDSVSPDMLGKAVFTGRNLSAGMYTLTAPGHFRYDFLMCEEQPLRIEVNADHSTITGSPTAEAYADYCALTDAQPEKQQAVARRKALIEKYPGTLLASYLSVLQPVPPKDTLLQDDIVQLMRYYQYQRQHFFDNTDLSDVRLLHTPLYYETLQYYFSKFVTQKADTLIHLAYRLIERASDNYETFFFVSDYLVDYSLRSDIAHIDRLYRFLRPNTYMLGTKALSLLPAKSRNRHFMLRDEETLRQRLAAIPLSDAEGKPFDRHAVTARYKIYYFWDADCPRCLSDAALWQTVLNKYQSKSCTGIAVNINANAPNHILPTQLSCIHVVAGRFPETEHIFLTNGYSKIIVTDTEGAIIGIFGSSSVLDIFLSMI
jgi:hypothetical protein